MHRVQDTLLAFSVYFLQVSFYSDNSDEIKVTILTLIFRSKVYRVLSMDYLILYA